MANLHRKNTAEWIMLIVIAPIIFVMRVFKRSEKKVEKEQPPQRRSVMIEGLPPRTMN